MRARYQLSTLFVVLFLLPRLVHAEEVLAGLSQHSVSLTTGYSGSQLFVYGAVKHVSGSPERPLDIIVAITGPTAPVMVRKKERQFGIWMNGPGVQIDAAPSFYAVATTKSFRETISWTDDMRYSVGLDHVIRLVDAPDWVTDREEYRRAVSRLRTQQGLYAVLPGAVTLTDDTLFETRIRLPASLVEGDYIARVFLLSDKEVIDVFDDKVEVRRAGIGRFVYTAAQEWPALYGLMSIVVALVAGWLASAFFRTFFPN